MQELAEAVEDIRQQDQRLLRFAAALYVASKAGVRQVDMVRTTGYTREQIRRYIEDERIRRGEIEATPRYLRNLERATKSAQT